VKYYIDTEFDGHNGPLISLAMVREDGYSMYVIDSYGYGPNIQDPWVKENVIPLLLKSPAEEIEESWVNINSNDMGGFIRSILDIDPDMDIEIIADSPVDIGRFCQALSTNEDGEWQNCNYGTMKFTVENVDCYPTTLEGAVQHNAWWDAMALREKLNEVY